MRRLVSLVLSTLVLQVVGVRNDTYSGTSLDKYLVDTTLAAILDAHADEVFECVAETHRKSQNHGVWQFDWLPGYFVKYGLVRLEGMEIIKECIKRFNLFLLGVPDKKVYHIKGRPIEPSNLNYVVVVKEVPKAVTPAPLTLEHVRQLSRLITHSHYVDLHVSNYVITPENKLVVIDTEGIFDKNLHIEGYLKLFCSNYTLSSSYTPGALRYLFHRVKERLQKDSPENRFYFSKIDRAFKKQKEPKSWDFDTYCYSLIASYRNAQ